jgi:hypothetical protein
LLCRPVVLAAAEHGVDQRLRLDRPEIADCAFEFHRIDARNEFLIV